LEISLKNIATYASEHEDDNETFRIWLKRQDSKKIDGLVHRLNKEIEPQIDCTTCGNCCSQLMINVEDAAVERLSERLGITQKTFLSRYVEKGGYMQVFNKVPCHFLADCKCTVYEHRPSACRDFPSLHQPNFNSRLFATFMHYSICPIIYNVVERLKEDSGYNNLS
jgi:Fe-S-cluster containining protein